MSAELLKEIKDTAVTGEAFAAAFQTTEHLRLLFLKIIKLSEQMEAQGHG